jgi:hypothetical protein
MRKSERLASFVSRLRNSHVDQGNLCAQDGDFAGVLVHDTVAEALTAVAALIDSLYDLEDPGYE